MSRIDRLTQWQSGGTSLRKLTRTRRAGDWAGNVAAQGEIDASDSTLETDAALGAARDAPKDAAALGTDLEAEVGERWLWGDDEDESAIPMEALSVYRMAGTWRDSTGELRATIHGFASEAAYARGECVLGQGSLWQEAAALSLQSLPAGDPADPGMERNRRANYDVRPHLLLLLQAQDSRALEPCLRYGRDYLSAWCERNGVRVTTRAIQAAAVDGLSLVYRLRTHRISGGRRTARLATPSTGRRSREVGMRNEDFARLRSLIAEVYGRRFEEGTHRFLACADYVAPKTGASEACAINPESWWHPERLPPAER